MHLDIDGNPTGEAQLYVVKVSCDTFDTPIIALPYDIDDLQSEKWWMFIEPRNQWLTIFQSCITELKEEVHACYED